MKKILVAVFVLGFSNMVAAEENPLIRYISPETTLENFAWTHRPIIVFSNSPDDINFKRQVNMLRSNIEELEERNVVVLLDSDPTVESTLRKTLRPRGFALILIGKDGQIKLRKPFPWDVRALSRTIDKMPMRRQEMKANE
jgi:hypothetical protein